MSFPRDDGWRRGNEPRIWRPLSRFPSGGRPARRRGSRTFPPSFGRWRGPASRNSPGKEGPSKWTRRSSTRPANSSDVIQRHGDGYDAFEHQPVRPALRHLVEPHLSLQPRLRTLLSRRGRQPLVGTENFADRSELGTEECFRVIDEIAAFAPECLTILTGGEPLLRRDILEIVRRAAERGLWVVVGINGVRITENLARRLSDAGARGLSLSLDALDPDRHDGFRKFRGAWQQHVGGGNILNPTGLPFIVQTTAGSHTSASSTRSPTSRTTPRARGSGTSTSWSRRAAGSSFGYHARAVRRGSRLALPHPAEIRPPDAREREVRAALHQDRAGACRRRDDAIPADAETLGNRLVDRSVPDQDLLRRGRRVPGGDALHGDPAERRRHPLSVSPGVRGISAQRDASRTSGPPRHSSGLRRRTSLGGRCGACEMNGHCGGCRARAYGMTGDVMAEIRSAPTRRDVRGLSPSRDAPLRGFS